MLQRLLVSPPLRYLNILLQRLQLLELAVVLAESVREADDGDVENVGVEREQELENGDILVEAFYEEVPDWVEGLADLVDLGHVEEADCEVVWAVVEVGKINQG